MAHKGRKMQHIGFLKVQRHYTTIYEELLQGYVIATLFIYKKIPLQFTEERVIISI